ncbi:DUF4367 domain-containing protein [Neofamilia massiliensis]|uniref:DUF4367 domain-containing protein n=1 Tax=Neofamilia massiliensis TaxID=1673724 RepID=UPI0006BB963F|nr:DUF4367 domain-containing protein [Neofamilia massiliensis]
MNKISDRQFDRLLEEALSLDFNSEIANTSKSPFNPSPDFQNKMAELFRKEDAKKFRLSSVLKKVAVFFLVSASILGIFLGTNTQARERIYSWIIEDFGLYSSFTAEKPSIDEESLSLDDLKINYIPEGFDLKEVQEGRINLIYQFINMQNKENFFIVHFRLLEENPTESFYDTEDTRLENIIISGRDGYFWQKKELTSILWKQNSIECNVYGNLNKDEIIKIGENISK